MFEGKKHYIHDNEYCYAILDDYRIDFITTDTYTSITQSHQGHETLTIYADTHSKHYNLGSTAHA